MATLHDVAKLANVSVATASRALDDSSKRHSVSPRARQAVERAAATLGYRPSAAARALKTGRSTLIGVIASDFLDSYYGEIARGVELEASRNGLVPILATANRDPREERQRLRLLREQNAAGVVFCSSPIAGSSGDEALKNEVAQAIAAGMHVVSLAPRGFGSIELVVDNELTGYEITQHLLALGHEKIVFLGGTEGLRSAELRIAGYKRAMSDAHCTANVLGRDGMTLEAGRRGARDAMTGSDRPTAIVATNDELAVGALAELLRLGFQVPDDVSIAGVGGTRMMRAFELTHIALPISALGSLAAAYIAADGMLSAQDINLPTPYLVQGSTSRSLH